MTVLDKDPKDLTDEEVAYDDGIDISDAKDPVRPESGIVPDAPEED